MDKPLEIVNQNDLLNKIDDLITQSVFVSAFQANQELQESIADQIVGGGANNPPDRAQNRE